VPVSAVLFVFTCCRFLLDLYVNDEMIRFWQSIQLAKYDVTSVGHGGAGTGIIDFSGGGILIKDIVHVPAASTDAASTERVWAVP
jgi:hypothetical protein